MSSMVSGGHHHHHHHHPASSYPYMFHHPPPDSLYNHPVSSSPRVPCQPAPAHSVNANTHPAAYPTSTHHASNTSPGATGTGNITRYIRVWEFVRVYKIIEKNKTKSTSMEPGNFSYRTSYTWLSGVPTVVTGRWYGQFRTVIGARNKLLWIFFFFFNEKSKAYKKVFAKRPPRR